MSFELLRVNADILQAKAINLVGVVQNQLCYAVIQKGSRSNMERNAHRLTLHSPARDIARK